jgi:hypothetical protein
VAAAIAGSAAASASATPLLAATSIAYTHDHFRRHQTNRYLRAFWMWTMLSKRTVRSGSRHLLQLCSSCATLPLSLRLQKHTTCSSQRPYKVQPSTSLSRTTTMLWRRNSSQATMPKSSIPYIWVIRSSRVITLSASWATVRIRQCGSVEIFSERPFNSYTDELSSSDTTLQE